MFDLFQSGYFFFTFDLKSGYHHIEIFPDHWQYLGFSWLGYCLDFNRCFISMPSAKIMKLKESISRILSQSFVTAKELASVAGQLISMHMLLAIGNTARLMSRSMYSQISEQVSWFCPFTLHDSLKSELVFWLSNLDQRNGRPIWFKSSTVRIAYSDASDTGYGGYIVELGPQVAAQGVWSSDMAKSKARRCVRF